jgi:hypothetical protein
LHYRSTFFANVFIPIPRRSTGANIDPSRLRVRIVSTPPSLGAHALSVEQQGMTDPVAIEIARLLGNGEQGRLMPALATKFPDRRPAEFEEALRDVIALQNLVAAELAECQRGTHAAQAGLQVERVFCV